MCPATDNPAKCEIRAVIRFLYTKNMSAAEIHRDLCAVYGKNTMSEGIVSQQCRMFKDGQTSVYDEERSDRTSVVSNDLDQSVYQKMYERQRFTISELSCEFSQISSEIIIG
jgi:hypothetical protein